MNLRQNERSQAKVQLVNDRNQIDRAFRTYQESIEKNKLEALLAKTQKMATFREAIARN